MKQSDMVTAIGERCDDVIDATTAVRWLNYGKNLMATAIGAIFPDLDPSNPDDEYVFPSKYHEGPIVYACSVYKEADSALAEVSNFMAKFEEAKKEFVRTYVVPPRYRDTNLYQQFTATANQSHYVITKNTYDYRYGDLVVYINDELVDMSYVTINDDNSFDIDTTSITIYANDAVTANWQEHADYQHAPYEWWETQGW